MYGLQMRELTPYRETSLKEILITRFAVDEVTSDRGTLSSSRYCFTKVFCPFIVSLAVIVAWIMYDWYLLTVFYQ